MGAMVALWLVLGFLLGGIMLALVMGYLSTEEARAQAQQRPAQVVRVADAIPSFFAKTESGARSAGMGAYDERLIARLESHVREEQALVGEFVLYPSIDSLYRPAPPALRAH